MKIKIIWFVLISCLFTSKMVVADDGKLVLDKIRLDIHIGRGDSSCGGLMNIDSGKDIPDMRVFNCYHSSGKYTMTLAGPPGTTVTLFENFSYGKERGYLIIRKIDDRQVWLLDLEDFPSDRWSQVEAERQSGAYEAFYHATPIFNQQISSIKWGTWWPKGGLD
jgi:hypothetical protein